MLLLVEPVVLDVGLDASYRTVAQRGWEAVADHVLEDGTLRGVCMGAVILAALAVDDL